MSQRVPYAESCEVLRQQGILEPGESPMLPPRPPRVDDADVRVGIRFFRTKLADVRLDSLTIPRTYVARSEMRNVTFRETDLSESTINASDLIDVDFGGSDLSRSDMRGCIFERVNFSGAVLRGVDLRRGRFRACNFAGADLTGARLSRLFGALLSLSRAQRAVIVWSWRGPAPEEG
jgi:uncharacterized protein YjbI with pentapeptide repeats